jgi:hypothetical protein
MAALATRNNIKAVVPAVLAALVIVIFIDGNIVTAVSLLLMSIIPGTVAGYLLGKRKPFFVTLCSTCLAICIGWIFELWVIDAFMGNGIDEMFAEVMHQFESISSQMLAGLDKSLTSNLNMSPEELKQAILSTAESTMRIYMPSVVVISAMLNGYVVVRISGFVIKRAHLANVECTPFSLIKAPKNMSLAAILFYLVYVFMSSESRLWPVFANLVFILYTIIGICGLSVVDFKFKNKIKSAPLRFLIYTAVLFLGGAFMNIISSVLIIIGILDENRNFRKIDIRDQQF